MRKTTRLRQLVSRADIAFLMETHSGLSARIAEEAGFEGIWGSGLSISAAFGVRDNNELSWSQVTDHVAFMADATTIPILLDGDTGYGNFNNMRRLVRKLEQAGVAGVTIEDKLFPKTNSFLRAELQPLADVDEFCGKIKAGKDSQQDPDFVLVARVEALIAGWGLAEALRRAEAYHLAGADAILIHSRSASPAEIFAFLEAWGNRSPVALVPTKYWRTPTEDFRARRVSVVIWADHLVRASIGAMQATARQLAREQSLLDIEPRVAPLPEVFRLQGDHELEEAERRYLPAARSAARAGWRPARAMISAGSPPPSPRRCSRCTAGRSSRVFSTISRASAVARRSWCEATAPRPWTRPAPASSTTRTMRLPAKPTRCRWPRTISARAPSWRSATSCSSATSCRPCSRRPRTASR